MYRPKEGHYIKIIYKLHNGEKITEITIYTSYIIKIIDYGRSFYEDKSNNSLNFLENLCKTPNCTNPPVTLDNYAKCKDYNKGYGFFEYERNFSQDLRLIQIMKIDYFVNSNFIKYLSNLPENLDTIKIKKIIDTLKSVQFDATDVYDKNGKFIRKTYFKTEENRFSGKNTNTINNLTDLFHFLTSEDTLSYQDSMNQMHFSGKTLLGTLEIDCSENCSKSKFMEYTPAM